MKIILINRKKLQVFLVVIILMAILFGTGEILKGQFKFVSFMQNDITELKSYDALNGNITYKLPSEWTTSTDSFPGGQIIYHNNFASKDLLINGIVQVWKEVDDLKGFLDTSRKVSEEQNHVKNYKIKDIKINNKEGYLIKYNMTSRGLDYTSYEYFIKYEKGFIRFSFFAKNKDFKENMQALYDGIAKTLEIKEG